MVKNNKRKVLIVMTFCLVLLSSTVYGMVFNDDIQKVDLDYYYYDGFGNDKIVQSVKDGSWHILKADGRLQKKYI